MSVIALVAPLAALAYLTGVVNVVLPLPLVAALLPLGAVHTVLQARYTVLGQSDVHTLLALAVVHNVLPLAVVHNVLQEDVQCCARSKGISKMIVSVLRQ